MRDPSADPRGALAPAVTRNHAAIADPPTIGETLRAIDCCAWYPPTQAALKFAPLVFVRPGKLRKAEWMEFDLDRGEWCIPVARMNMRERHIVALAKQAIAILRELHPVTGRSSYILPSLRSVHRPMSENAITAALRRMGGEEMSGHGFRSMASPSLNEQSWHPARLNCSWRTPSAMRFVRRTTGRGGCLSVER